MRSHDHHRPCPCGAELEDECPKCSQRNPLGAMRFVSAVGSRSAVTAEDRHDERCESDFIPEAGAWTPCRCGERRRP